MPVISAIYQVLPDDVRNLITALHEVTGTLRGYRSFPYSAANSRAGTWSPTPPTPATKV